MTEGALSPPQAPASRAGSTEPLPWGLSLRIFAALGLKLAFQGKRALIVALALVVPIVIAFAWKTLIRVPRGLSSSEELLIGFTVILYLNALVPLVTLLLGTSVISDEWEGKTLTYLFTRPVRKSAVVFGKAIGMWLLTAALVAASFGATAALIWSKRLPTDFGAHPNLVFSLLGIVVLGTLPYAAFFVFLGTLLRRPLIAGLVFAFGLEKLLSWLPLSVQKLTFAHYLRALTLPFADASDMLRELLRGPLRGIHQPGVGEAIAWLAGFTVLFAGLAAWVVSRREYILSKGD